MAARHRQGEARERHGLALAQAEDPVVDREAGAGGGPQLAVLQVAVGEAEVEGEQREAPRRNVKERKGFRGPSASDAISTLSSP